jgi:nitroimidazol reductase NimA-like FMN-containing flavoprotein (pyridoxamine 5'-phosphate oxidase superfamily)
MKGGANMDYQVRRTDREMGDRGEMEALLGRALVGRIATCRDAEPYVVPLCFVYEAGKIYFHAAWMGKKMDYLKANPRVCFEVDEWLGLIQSQHGCAVSVQYRSVVAYGRYAEVADEAERLRVLELLSHKYAGRPNMPMEQSSVDATLIGQIAIESMTGKKNG